MFFFPSALCEALALYYNCMQTMRDEQDGVDPPPPPPTSFAKVCVPMQRICQLLLLLLLLAVVVHAAKVKLGNYHNNFLPFGHVNGT